MDEIHTVTEFNTALKESDDFARFIFNTATEDVKTTLSSIGRKAKDRQMMRLFDTYCSGYLFLLSLTLTGRYGDEANERLEVIFIDVAKLLVFISGELACGSNYVSDYQNLHNNWRNEDPMSNPILYTVQLVKDEFGGSPLETVMDCYSNYQKTIDEAFQKLGA